MQKEPSLKVYTSEEMLKTKLPKGCIFHNIAHYNLKARWIIERKPVDLAPLSYYRFYPVPNTSTTETDNDR